MVCSICLEEEIKEPVYLPCSHKFHSCCIDKWLNKSLICPVCRIIAVLDIHTYMEVADTDAIFINNISEKQEENISSHNLTPFDEFLAMIFDSSIEIPPEGQIFTFSEGNIRISFQRFN